MLNTLRPARSVFLAFTGRACPFDTPTFGEQIIHYKKFTCFKYQCDLVRNVYFIYIKTGETICEERDVLNFLTEL